MMNETMQSFLHFLILFHTLQTREPSKPHNEAIQNKMHGWCHICITPSAHIPAHSPWLQVVAKVKVLLPFFSFLHQTINDFIQLYIFKFLSLSKLTCYTVTSGNTEPQRVFLRSSNPAIIRGHCSYHRVQIKCLRMSLQWGGSVNQMNL